MINKALKFLICAVLLLACDLQPKLASVPDNVADLIMTRYPALLADPETNPEIYNSAAVDYGVYASPDVSGEDEVLVYKPSDKYTYLPPESTYGSSDTIVADDYLVVPMYGGDGYKKTGGYVIVQKGDTLYSLSKRYDTTVDALAIINNLSAPYGISVGQKLKLTGTDVDVAKTPQTVSAPTVSLKEISVAKGDTLYSLSRRYLMPVNDLAVLNKLTAPFTLSVGQKIKVPDIKPVEYNPNVITVADKPASVYGSESKPDTKTVAAKPETKTTTVTTVKKTETAAVKTPAVKAPATPVAVKEEPKKISSNPAQKIPTLASRSSSKFSWPVRGKILSGYGAKSGGLFNDGINISAKSGTAVRAAENGAVAYAGNEVKGMGNLVIIQHSGGWMTVYAHMDKMSVRRGTKVKVGQQIGTVGQTGKVDAPQLHFEIRKGSKAYNPTAYMKK